MERAIPILPVEDLDVAKEFYVDRLGFGIRFEHRGEGRDGLLGVERGSIELTLDCPMTGHGREACVTSRWTTPTRTTTNGAPASRSGVRRRTSIGGRARST